MTPTEIKLRRKSRVLEVAFDDGSRWPVDRLERPFVLLDAKDAPSHLFVAVKRGDESANLALPLRR